MAHDHTRSGKHSTVISSKNKVSTAQTNILPAQQQIMDPLLSTSSDESSDDEDEIA